MVKGVGEVMEIVVLELLMPVSFHEILGTEPVSFARATSALNC